MDAATWDRIQSTFLEALDVATSGRNRWLDEACADAPHVAREVREMLASHATDGLGVERVLLDDAAGGGWSAGDRVGPWELERRLGQGGMGEVWLGRRSGDFEQRAAVKLVRPGWRAAQLVSRFRRERRILARLEHPNIATFLDGGVTDDGQPWLAMEYVRGAPVTEWCVQRSSSVAKRVKLFRGICDAVAFAHANLVIHRDLKPANILVTDDGRPMLLDFGIAKLLDPLEEDEPATRPDERLLTPESASPEQLRGESVTTATDVWAMGALLHELLAGVPPHPATDDGPSPPSSRAPAGSARELRGDLDAIVLAALRNEPVRRTPSVEALSADLGRWARGEPVHAVPDSFGYRARKFVRRHRVSVTVGTLVAALVIAFAVVTGEQASRIARERDRVAEERDRAEQILQALVGLFETSNPRVVPGGDTLRVVDLLDGAEERFATLENRPDVRARLWETLSEIHSARSRFDRAREANDRARTAAEAADLPDLARKLDHDRGRLTRFLDGDATAEPLLRASLQRHERELDPADPSLAVALQDLAAVIRDPDERERLLTRSLAIRRKSGDTLQVAAALNALGQLHWSCHRFENARARFEEALDHLLEERDAEHPHALVVSGNLAYCDLQAGRWEESLTRHREILEIRQRVLGEQTVEVASNRSAIGQCLAHLGRHEEAVAELQQVVQIEEALLGPDHPRLLTSRRNLVLARAATGAPEAPAEMRALADAAGRLLGEESGEAAFFRVQAQWARLAQGKAPDRPVDADMRRLEDAGNAGLADALVVRGVATLLAGGDPGLAQRDFRRAADLRRAELPATHPKRLEAACGLSAAHAAAGDPGGPREEAAAALAAYESWGLRLPPLVRQARAALAR